MPSLRMNDQVRQGISGSTSQDGITKVYDAINEDSELPTITYPDSDAAKAIIEFHASSAAVMESIGTFKVLICRHGKLNNTVKVRVETIDGSANEGEDYQAVDEIQWEPDEEFFLKLSLLSTGQSKEVKLGRTS